MKPFNPKFPGIYNEQVMLNGGLSGQIWGNVCFLWINDFDIREAVLLSNYDKDDKVNWYWILCKRAARMGGIYLLVFHFPAWSIVLSKFVHFY